MVGGENEGKNEKGDLRETESSQSAGLLDKKRKKILDETHYSVAIYAAHISNVTRKISLLSFLNWTDDLKEYS